MYHTRDYNWGYAGRFTYVKCAECGLVYENPCPRPEIIKELYPKYYAAHGPVALPDAENETNVSVHSLRAQAIEKYCSHGTLLDIGCGRGLFLEYMRRREWNVCGLDSAPEHIDYARAHLGLADVQVASWPLSGELPLKPDAVTMFHVLEHLESPVESLLAAHNVLMPEGILVIETPNINSWPARIFGARSVALDAPRHLALFSSKTLQKAVESAGFRILELRSVCPSIMDYSDSIRYLLNDLGIRCYQKKYSEIAKEKGRSTAGQASQEAPSAAGKISGIALHLLHGCEDLLYSGLNRVATLCGAGNNLLLVARKSGKAGL